MAELHPAITTALTPGQYREHEMLRLLADALPATFRLYHGVHWSGMHESTQRFGEFDVIVLAPGGDLAVLEIKAGEVDLSEQGLFKTYGGQRKDIARQTHAQLNGLIGRLREAHLGEVAVTHFLLLPDYRVADGSIGYPRERIIDATQLDDMAQLLIEATRHGMLSAGRIDDLRHFLANRFAVVVDAACRQGQRQAATLRLSEGLATWVPRIESPSGLYVVEATAGSGKTQLALALLQSAAKARQRACYVCFNRPLADHIVALAPSQTQVATLHELAIDALRASGVEPDFSNPRTFEVSFAALSAASAQVTSNLDLLVIDESQDFEAEWIQALLPRLKASGRLYMMGDPDQAIYRKDDFELPDATRIVCHDNFRSPRRVIDTLNAFALSDVPVVAKGPDIGVVPGLHVHEADDAGGLGCTTRLIDELLRSGQRLDNIVVLSFRGHARSQLLGCHALGNHNLRRYSGDFDAAGNARWTAGELRAESVYRFKGQSAPVVIVCEIDFTELDDITRRKLFVAMTRAQAELHLVMTVQAEQVLVQCLQNPD